MGTYMNQLKKPAKCVMKIYKQWELLNNSKVKLLDGSVVTFLKMDGMYAQWEEDGQLKIGNFKNGFKKSYEKGINYELIK